MSNIQTKFSVGRTLATPGALAAMKAVYGKYADDALYALFVRHARGDWGNLSEEDRAANEHALKSGERLFSSYNLPPASESGYEARVWIITEWDRSYTTALLPEDY